jgi:hypothetical protein
MAFDAGYPKVDGSVRRSPPVDDRAHWSTPAL